MITRADGGVDDIADPAAAEVDAQLRQQPARQQRADDADHDIADQAETCAAHDQSGKPARNTANDQRRNDAH